MCHLCMNVCERVNVVSDVKYVGWSGNVKGAAFNIFEQT